MNAFIVQSLSSAAVTVLNPLLSSPTALRFRKPKFTLISQAVRHFSISQLKVLDVGIANNSQSEWLAVFPKTLRYDGLDAWDAGSFRRNESVLDRTLSRFYQVNLDNCMPSAAIEDQYNIICASHVLEHLAHPYEVISDLLGLLDKGGILYLEYPSIASLRPSLLSSYNFYGDSTHVQPIDSALVVDRCRGSRVRFHRAGKCLTIGKAIYSSGVALSRLLRMRQGWRGSLLYVAGMVDCCLIQKI